MADTTKNYALCGAIRRMGESDDCIVRLAIKDGILAKYVEKKLMYWYDRNYSFTFHKLNKPKTSNADFNLWRVDAIPNFLFCIIEYFECCVKQTLKNPIFMTQFELN